MVVGTHTAGALEDMMEAIDEILDEMLKEELDKELDDEELVATMSEGTF